MTPAQRRATWAVCLIVGISLLMAAGLTFLVTPMAEDLGLADNIVEDVLAIPSVAALVMVFSAGRLCDRLGARRTLSLASVAFSLGASCVALAGNEYPVEIGLAICAAAAVTLQIVGVSLLQQATGGGPAQVSAFTSFGVVFPLAFLMFPVVTARLLVVSNWRIVPLVWIVAGLVMLAITLALVERGHGVSSVGEWGTPLLAGIALATGARAISELDDLRIDPALIGLSSVLCILAVTAFLAVRRRVPRASFTIDPIRGNHLPLLLVAVALVSLSGLLTYVSIAIEYLYALTPYQASLAVIPAQIGAILGAKLMAKQALSRWGGIQAARILMLSLAAAMLPLLLLRVDSPLWFLAAIATVFSFVWMAVLTVLNAEVMRRAPKASTGAVSALRTAASSLGGALGVGTLGVIAISSMPVQAGTGAVSLDDLAVLTNSLRVDGLLAAAIAVVGWMVLGRARRSPALADR